MLGLSDPLTAPTGFGRVAREIFARLDRKEYELAYVSRSWIGSSRFDLETYSTNSSDEVCAAATAVAAQELVRRDPEVHAHDPPLGDVADDRGREPRHRAAHRATSIENDSNNERRRFAFRLRSCARRRRFRASLADCVPCPRFG